MIMQTVNIIMRTKVTSPVDIFTEKREKSL